MSHFMKLPVTRVGKDMHKNVSRKVDVLPYNAQWPDLFRQEAKRIQHVLGAYLTDIYHIGSTSIVHMSAKPVIDVMLSIDNLDEIQAISKKLDELSYAPVSRQIIPHKSFITSRQDKDIRFHVHIHERGSPQIKRHVYFRDYAIQHQDVARAYQDLKIQLAKQYPQDIDSYVLGKAALVQEIDAKAKCWQGRKRDFCLPNTGGLAKDWGREQLVKASIANLNVHMTHFAQYLNEVELIRVPGFTIVHSGLLDDTFNYVIDADFSPVDADKKISEITHYFKEKNTPFSWWVSPLDNPEDLSHHLECHGYENTENNRAMYFDLDAWDGSMTQAPSLHIVRATDEKTLHDFALVLCHDETVFKTYFSKIASILTDDDPIEYYVGYVDGIPVVRGLSCYFAQVAGLHWLSTAPAFRNKGYGRAMQQYRLKRAKTLGYHIAVLQASNEGYSLYQRLGYKEYGQVREFKLKPHA